MFKQMKTITQKEALKVLDKTPYPRNRGVNRERLFFLRFMFNVNKLAKGRGYRLFTAFEIVTSPETWIAGSWLLSNIEVLSQNIITEKKQKMSL